MQIKTYLDGNTLSQSIRSYGSEGREYIPG